MAQVSLLSTGLTHTHTERYNKPAKPLKQASRSKAPAMENATTHHRYSRCLAACLLMCSKYIQIFACGPLPGSKVQFTDMLHNHCKTLGTFQTLHQSMVIPLVTVCKRPVTASVKHTLRFTLTHTEHLHNIYSR